MALIKFTKEEIQQALPLDLSTDERGTANAWQIFTSMDRADNAAKFINWYIVDFLSNGEGIPLHPFELNEFIERVSESLNLHVTACLNKYYGESFGFSDTEPCIECHKFIRRLLAVA